MKKIMMLAMRYDLQIEIRNDSWFRSRNACTIYARRKAEENSYAYSKSFFGDELEALETGDETFENFVIDDIIEALYPDVKSEKPIRNRCNICKHRGRPYSYCGGCHGESLFEKEEKNESKE